MTIQEQIHVRALALTEELDGRRESLLKLFATGALQTLMGRLKEGVSVESCREELICAGSLYALAALMEADAGPARFSAGELTVEKDDIGRTAAALRRQGDLILGPFADGSFAFRGV